MAWTLTKKEISTYGNFRIVIMSCTADAATQNVDTGLSRVYGHTITPYSMATAIALTLVPNYGATSTAIAGYIGCSGFAANDQFCLVAYGQGR